MLDLPIHIPLLMAACCVAGVFALYHASEKNARVFWVCSLWLLLQSCISITGFYLADTSSPRFLLIIGPPFLLIPILFWTSWGKHFLDQLDLDVLMWSNTIRIPLELCFFWLNQHGHFPTEMTFDGRNFGYLAGLTAPFIIWFTMPANTAVKRRALVAWNIVCIGLMINSIRVGILSSPNFAAKYGYEIPNSALGYFPFVWQPSYIVPYFFLAHLVVIRRMWKTSG